jgi:hypothetical protein
MSFKEAFLVALLAVVLPRAVIFVIRAAVPRAVVVRLVATIVAILWILMPLGVLVRSWRWRLPSGPERFVPE